MSDQEVAVWYNDNVIYPDKVRLNCYYYRHYSFVKDIQMILCTVLGRKMKYEGRKYSFFATLLIVSEVLRRAKLGVRLMGLLLKNEHRKGRMERKQLNL